MNILFESIFNNYLLILFTISCFSTMFCCQNRTMYKYRLITQEENKDEFKWNIETLIKLFKIPDG